MMKQMDLLSGIYEHKATIIGYTVIIALLTAILISQARRNKMIRKENKRIISYINAMAENEGI